MNTNTYLAFFIAIFVLPLTACAKTSLDAPEKIAKTIAQIIIKQDKKAFAQHVVDQNGYMQIFQLQLDLEKSDSKDKRRIPQLENIPDLAKTLSTLKSGPHKKIARINTTVKMSFDRLIKYAKRDGVDLSKASFGKITHIGNTRKHLKLAQYDIYFTLSLGGKDYKIKLDDVVSTPGRFYILDGIKWRGSN